MCEGWCRKVPPLIVIMRNKRVYVSGPLTDPCTGRVSAANLAVFRTAVSWLRQHSMMRVVDPTNVWVCRWPWLYGVLEWLFGSTGAYGLVLLYDLWLLMRCDYIYKIPGWRESRGANVESCVAFHFRVFPYATQERREILDKRLAKLIDKYASNVAND